MGSSFSLPLPLGGEYSTPTNSEVLEEANRYTGFILLVYIFNGVANLKPEQAHTSESCSASICAW